ncbi:MAG: endolytic transglycosylase MltG [Patescibacteria group bacterium]|nr:endolytic transglycosylase MltG [Patescibacteria group bacterium]
MKTIFRSVIFFTILFLFAALSGLLYIEWQIHRSFNESEGTRQFAIAEGQGVKEIAGNLQKEGFIRDAWYFEVYVWTEKREKDFKAGEFKLPPKINIPETVRVLTGKPEPKEIDITIIEGWDRQDIDQYLAGLKLIERDDFIVATRGFKDSIFADRFEAPPESSLEGFLFPDTYRVYKDQAAVDLLKKMLANFQKKVGSDLLVEIERQGKSLYDILIMASIVEKESANEEEMPKIAGVFYNRLELDRSLESDATVNYVTGKKSRQPTLEDVQMDSRYNTYRYKGLPPGPICNPGLAAIRAAIYPEETDYLYFLHPEGQPVVFSKNLQEHNLNKQKYLP